jgi:hypothetical protein
MIELNLSLSPVYKQYNMVCPATENEGFILISCLTAVDDIFDLS